MKKFVALSLALALTFSSTVSAKTVVGPDNYPIIDDLAISVEKSLPEYTSNAVEAMDGVRDLAPVASGTNLITEGKLTPASVTVDKVDVGAIRYAQQKAYQLGGKMLNVVELSAPGVNLVNAQAQLRVEGVKAGDVVSVFRAVSGNWVAVDVLAVADNSVTISFPAKGIYTLIK